MGTLWSEGKDLTDISTFYISSSWKFWVIELSTIISNQGFKNSEKFNKLKILTKPNCMPLNERIWYIMLVKFMLIIITNWVQFVLWQFEHYVVLLYRDSFV